eukprot:scaffold1330_cov240-Pinguiococcus_pyrenoidosus.AAC.23
MRHNSFRILWTGHIWARMDGLEPILTCPCTSSLVLGLLLLLLVHVLINLVLLLLRQLVELVVLQRVFVLLLLHPSLPRVRRFHRVRRVRRLRRLPAGFFPGLLRLGPGAQSSLSRGLPPDADPFADHARKRAALSLLRKLVSLGDVLEERLAAENLAGPILQRSLQHVHRPQEQLQLADLTAERIRTLSGGVGHKQEVDQYLTIAPEVAAADVQVGQLLKDHRGLQQIAELRGERWFLRVVEVLRALHQLAQGRHLGTPADVRLLPRLDLVAGQHDLVVVHDSILHHEVQVTAADGRTQEGIVDLRVDEAVDAVRSVSPLGADKVPQEHDFPSIVQARHRMEVANRVLRRDALGVEVLVEDPLHALVELLARLQRVLQQLAEVHLQLAVIFGSGRRHHRLRLVGVVRPREETKPSLEAPPRRLPLAKA